MIQSDAISQHDANYALDELRRLLTAPGQNFRDGKLPAERDLTSTLGVTRHALRRALVVLEAEGLIWRRQGAGTFISSPGREAAESLTIHAASTTFEEIVETRLRLEPQLAQLAAVRASLADIERMREVNRRAIEASDPESCELWDGAFHRQIAQASGNKMLLSLFDVVNRVRHDSAWQQIRATARNGQSANAMPVAHHYGIIDAIAARDPVTAGLRMRDHLLDIQMRLTRSLSDPLIGADQRGASVPAQHDEELTA